VHKEKTYLVPSQNLVVLRIGYSGELEEFASSNFDNELWDKINAVIN
jgi:hypothetical protein